MGKYTEINPIDKKREICLLLDKIGIIYDVHCSGESKGYEYLNGKDICIIIKNQLSEKNLYVYLVDNGDFTLSYNSWHTHYSAKETDYNKLCEHLVAILQNRKCIQIINSNKGAVGSILSDKINPKDFDLKKEDKWLTEELNDRSNKQNAHIDAFFWDSSKNFRIDL